MSTNQSFQTNKKSDPTIHCLLIKLANFICKDPCNANQFLHSLLCFNRIAIIYDIIILLDTDFGKFSKRMHNINRTETYIQKNIWELKVMFLRLSIMLIFMNIVSSCLPLKTESTKSFTPNQQAQIIENDLYFPTPLEYMEKLHQDAIMSEEDEIKAAELLSEITNSSQILALENNNSYNLSIKCNDPNELIKIKETIREVNADPTKKIRIKVFLGEVQSMEALRELLPIGINTINFRVNNRENPIYIEAKQFISTNLLIINEDIINLDQDQNLFTEKLLVLNNDTKLLLPAYADTSQQSAELQSLMDQKKLGIYHKVPILFIVEEDKVNPFEQEYIKTLQIPTNIHNSPLQIFSSNRSHGEFTAKIIWRGVDTSQDVFYIFGGYETSMTTDLSPDFAKTEAVVYTTSIGYSKEEILKIINALPPNGIVILAANNGTDYPYGGTPWGIGTDSNYLDNSQLIIVTDTEEDGDEYGFPVTQITSDAFFTNSMQNAQSLILLASGEDRLIGFNGKTIENTYVDGTSFAAPKIANIAINSILTQGSSVPDLLNQLRTKSELVTHNYGKDISILPNYNVLQTSFTYSEAIKIAPNVNISTTSILEIKVELVPNQQPFNIFTNYLFSLLDSPKGPWNLDESKDNTFQIPAGRASYYYYYSNFPIRMKILKTDGTIEYIPITVQQIIDAGLYQIFQYPQYSTASIKIAELTEVSALLVDVTTPTAIPTMFPTSTPTIPSTPTPAQLPTSTPTPAPTPTVYNLLYFLPTIIYNKN